MPRPELAAPIIAKVSQILDLITAPDTLVTTISQILAPLIDPSDQAAHGQAMLQSFRYFAENTVFGDYVTQIIVALQQTPFTALMRLCQQFERYKKRKKQVRTALGGNQNALDHSIDLGLQNLTSTPESIAYLHREAEIIESLVGVLPRHVITERIEKLRNRLPHAPQVCFLFYLVCLHHGDYLGAVDKLHQYFDHLLVQHSMPNSTLLPYAVLNLAAVHLRFGHIDEALELVREVTAHVQRRKDDVCLARTLSLLYRLSEHRCDPSYQFQLLQQTLARSLTLCISNLSSQTLMDAAKHYLLHPRESGGLASIPIESDGSYSSATARPDAVWRLINASMSAATRTSETPTSSARLTSQALVATSSTWSVYGNQTMADLASRLQLDVHRSHNLQALSSAFSTDSSASTALISTTKLPTIEACASLCALAKSAAEMGQERETFELLLEAYDHYPVSSASADWIRVTRQILQDMSLRRKDIDAAEIQAIQLCALSPLNLDLHYHIDALYRLCVVLIHKGAYTRANTLIQSLIETCEGAGLTLMAVAFRLTQADLFLRAHAASDTSAPPIDALQPLLQCLSLARTFKLDTIAATASIQLARIHLLMEDIETSQKRARKAISLIDSVMPHVLQHGSATLKANAKLEYAKANILLMTSMSPSSALQSAKSGSQAMASSRPSTAAVGTWNDAMDDLDDVIDACTKLSEKEMLIEAYYFKARLANALGLNVQRNMAAKQFKTLLLSTPRSEGSAAPHTSFISTSMQYYLDGNSLRQLMSKFVK